MPIGMVSAFAREPLIAQAQTESPARWMLFTLALLGDPALTLRIDVPAAVEPVAAGPVPALALSEPAPNPFVAQTAIVFDLARDVNDSDLAIYDAGGRLRHRLVAGPLARGRHAVRWSGEDIGGEVPPGTYFLRFEADGAVVSRKIVRFK